ncbi:MAG: M6 family metalloprotease domain-containing protein [Candidatus Krumholzibacteriia bacterium]
MKTGYCLFVLALVATAVAVAAPAVAQIVPPAPGVEMPQSYYDRIADDPTAFQFQNAWVDKARRAREFRRELELTHPGGLDLASLPEDVRRRAVVAGTVRVPVIMIEYSNRAAPYPTATLAARLFTNPSGTMTDLYTEMSYGNVTLTGDVWGWVTAANTDAFYEGGCQGICNPGAKTGQLILEALQGVDGSVDFGQYDNDGPDGLPNSGDDDGLVDFVAIVQPEIGAECGTSNMWSHRWVVDGWPEFPGPWVTNDARTGGGFIRVRDYTIQPALGSTNGCGSGTIEIGVFAHEFGHAFGLPDLYDTNQGGQGIGHHGLMGSGNWRLPPNPTHMCAWSKVQLGWLSPTVIEGASQTATLNSVELNPEVIQLNVMEEKFNRNGFNPIAGGWSLHCGLTNFAALNRNWPGSGGYGNNWDEAVRRDFNYDGVGTVTLQYDVSWDTEATYDFGFVKIKVGATENTLRTYTGMGSTNAVTVDLTPFLSGATPYQIILQFTSDFAVSDEDGVAGFNSGTGGPFKLDNISVTGGGESYASDLETCEDGWYYDFTANPNKEYFLVENRNTAGASFDQNLWGNGFYIWHIEDNLGGDNTSGSTTTANLRPANVELRQADGLNHLRTSNSRGDSGDMFPGSSSNALFDNASNPSSRSHNTFDTQVVVSNIPAAAAAMTADFRGGYFPPVLSSITPVTGELNTIVPITDVTGASFVRGAVVALRDAGMTEYPASPVVWVCKTQLTGSIDLTGVPKGTYDVVVRNPDGQQSTLSAAFTVTDPVPVFIQFFGAKAREGGVELSWRLWADEAISGFAILRRADGSTSERRINTGALLGHTARTYMDRGVQPGGRYEYSLIVVLPDGTEMRSPLARAEVPGLELALFQNYPNPFNPNTRIQFSLPNAQFVSLNIYDPRGARVRTLVHGVGSPGTNEAEWDGTNDAGNPVSSGIYLYQLNTGGRVLTRKLMLLK